MTKSDDGERKVALGRAMRQLTAVAQICDPETYAAINTVLSAWEDGFVDFADGDRGQEPIDPFLPEIHSVRLDALKLACAFFETSPGTLDDLLHIAQRFSDFLLFLEPEDDAAPEPAEESPPISSTAKH